MVASARVRDGIPPPNQRRCGRGRPRRTASHPRRVGSATVGAATLAAATRRGAVDLTRETAVSGLTMIIIGLVLGLAGGWSIRTVLTLAGLRRRLAAGQRLQREPARHPGDRARHRLVRLVDGAPRGHPSCSSSSALLVGAARGRPAVPPARGRRRQPAARRRLHPRRSRSPAAGSPRRPATGSSPGAPRSAVRRWCSPVWACWSAGCRGCATRARPGRPWSGSRRGSPCRSPSGSAHGPSGATTRAEQHRASARPDGPPGH